MHGWSEWDMSPLQEASGINLNMDQLVFDVSQRIGLAQRHWMWPSLDLGLGFMV